MDPDATLAELRALSAQNMVNELNRQETDRFVELFDSLDGWMTRSGFKPAAWSVV